MSTVLTSEKELLRLFTRNKFQINLNDSEIEESYNSLIFLAKAISRYLSLKGNLPDEKDS